jgi:type II secretory pathway pseudopilin PulG
MARLIKTPSEDSAHWYLPDGTPFYEVENKSKPGEMRPVTLRDVRPVLAKPSVTNVLNLMAKPGLTKWLVEQGILASLTLPRIDGESDDAFAARVAADAAQESKKAMDFGTRVHSAIEDVIAGNDYDWDAEVEPYGLAFIDWWRENKRSFRGTITDWKTQNFTAGKKPTCYPEWCYQLAAYLGAITQDMRTGEIITERVVINHEHGYGGRLDFAWLEPDDAGTCRSVAVSSREPGLIVVRDWKREEVLHGYGVFLAACELWRRVKKYDPREVNNGVQEGN